NSEIKVRILRLKSHDIILASVSDLDDLVKLYFRLSFSNKEILQIIAYQHEKVINVQILKRICRRLGLFRKKNQTDMLEVLDFVQREITTTGQLQGYYWLNFDFSQNSDFNLRILTFFSIF
ncbi:hypothetical protein LDENG_00271790, partial [Lucifuga dentata]